MTSAATPLSDAALPDAAVLLSARTAETDTLVCGIFGEEFGSAPSGKALLAVGGYGRRELFPCSDVDLLLLCRSADLSADERSACSQFLQRLWDSGLRISHSVHTVEECCRIHDGNLELSVSLLDQRFLAGDRSLHSELQPRFARFVHSERQGIGLALCRKARARHTKHDGSIYELEPDIKDSPGGIRDYQVVRWLALLKNSSPDGLEIPEIAPYLREPAGFLYALRCWLHQKIGRDSNMLTFDLQDEVSPRPAEWMRTYYRHARTIHRAALREIDATEMRASSLLVQFRDWRSRVANSEFSVSRERVFVRRPSLLENDPEAVLRLFLFVARHGLPLAPEAERLAARSVEGIRKGAAVPPWPAWAELLRLPHAGLALRSMRDTGVLAAMFPEWAAIDCLVVRDYYHRYTVDEHSIRAIEIVLALRGGHSHYADIFAELDDPAPLLFALLFHDVGKSVPSEGGHVQASVNAAERAIERIEAPDPQRRTIRSLIALHLELSNVLQSRDLEDDAIIRGVAQLVGTLEILKQLTLMTYADISAVNPAALTPWRAEQLRRLYVRTYNELTRELETDRIQPDADGVPFLEGLPVRYLSTHSPDEIDAHLVLEHRSREHGIAVDIRRQNGSYRLTLITADRPALLACVSGVLAGFGFNILKVEGFANRSGVVLDEFVFADPLRTLELNPAEVDRLRLTVERAISGKVDVKRLLQGRPKPRRPGRGAAVQPVVSFDAEASRTATLLQVVAEDRPGLLYDVARTITDCGCNIELILADTEAHKAIDVFYLTQQGHKVPPEAQARLRAAILEICEPGR